MINILRVVLALICLSFGLFVLVCLYVQLGLIFGLIVIPN